MKPNNCLFPDNNTNNRLRILSRDSSGLLIPAGRFSDSLQKKNTAMESFVPTNTASIVPDSSFLTSPIISNDDTAAQYILNHRRRETHKSIYYMQLLNQALTEKSEQMTKKLTNGIRKSFLVPEAKFGTLQIKRQQPEQMDLHMLQTKKTMAHKKLNGVIPTVNVRKKETGSIIPVRSNERLKLCRTAIENTVSNSNGKPCIGSGNSISNALDLTFLHSTHHSMVTFPTVPPLLSPTRSNINNTQQQHLKSLQLCQIQPLQQENIKPKGRPSVFPQKLYQMLCDLEKLPHGTEIASFLPNGRAFAIHRPQQLIEEVIPYYFNLTSITSFRRQLRIYGFELIATGSDQGAYYHEFFIRGQPILCCRIKRFEASKAR